MSHGRIARASRRYPDARRRARRYGATHYGKGGRSLPPNLLSGSSAREQTSKFLGGPLGILTLLGIVGLTIGLALFVTSAITAAVGVVGTMRAYEEVNAELPNAAEIAVDTFQTTRIYDRNGTLLQEVDNPNHGWRNYVGIDQMAEHFINATVAAEDATFWTNHGVEPYAIVRGAFINLSGSGRSGGSTITQQLVRAVFPDQINPMDISYSRKWREALAAYALAQQYSKTDIFTMYVNQIYYGNRAFGIEAAANTYFDKHASDLTLAEASYLAGLPQSPSWYADNFESAKLRQRYVLDQMVRYGYVTRAEADAAWAETLSIQGTRTGRVRAAPHFTEYVRLYVIEKYGIEALYGGLEITTSLDLSVQARAEQIVANGVANMLEAGRNNGAMVVMVPWSGEVLAMVGSADFNNALINGEVNYSTALIQPGSSIKPIVYAAAFQDGMHPGSVMMDVPTIWDVNGQDEPYQPNNYSGRFYGAIPVREALANSLNIPAVKATEYVGVQGVIDVARSMGLVDSLERDASFYGLALGLGAGEVQLLEHTNAYATLANNGTWVPPHPITRITDSQGNVLFDLDEEQIAAEAKPGVTPGNAYQVTSILTDNDAREMIFTTNNLFGRTEAELGRPVAAKSGTTDQWKDLWTMGYTTDLAVGVWVGTSGSSNVANLPEIDGIQAAGPIWSAMMIEMHSNPEFSSLLHGPNGQPLPEEFPVPSDAYRGEICAATGNRPGSGSRTVEEWLVRGQEPDRACGELSDWERRQIEEAILATRQGDVRWAGDAVNTIARYAQVAGVRGISVTSSGGSSSGSSQPPPQNQGPPIEPVNEPPPVEPEEPEAPVDPPTVPAPPPPTAAPSDPDPGPEPTQVPIEPARLDPRLGGRSGGRSPR